MNVSVRWSFPLGIRFTNLKSFVPRLSCTIFRTVSSTTSGWIPDILHINSNETNVRVVSGSSTELFRRASWWSVIINVSFALSSYFLMNEATEVVELSKASMEPQQLRFWNYRVFKYEYHSKCCPRFCSSDCRFLNGNLSKRRILKKEFGDFVPICSQLAYILSYLSAMWPRQFSTISRCVNFG